MTQRLRAPLRARRLQHSDAPRSSVPAGENVRGCYFQFSGRVRGTTAEGGTYLNYGYTGDFYTALLQGPQFFTSNDVSSTTDVEAYDCAPAASCKLPASFACCPRRRCAFPPR
jgi:hypothetical protein